MAAEQDRRSRMAYTTYKAPAKKEGAGGAFTWGSPLDSATFYDSRVITTPGVSLVRAPIAQPSIAVAQTLPVMKDRVAFPTLGSAKSPVSSSSPRFPTVSSAVPTSAPKPAKVLLERIVSTRSAGSVESAPQDFTKIAQPVSYQSRPIEQDRHSRMAFTTYKEPAKKDGAGGTFTWGSPLDSATFYESRVTATPGVTLAPAPIVQPTLAVAQTLPDILDPVVFPTFQEQVVEFDVITAQNVTEDLAVIEIAQGMDESQQTIVIEEEWSLVERTDSAIAAVVVTQVEEAAVPKEAASPSEISAEEEASEESSSRLPLKPNATTTTTPACLQGCFEVIAEKKAIFFKHY